MKRMICILSGMLLAASTAFAQYPDIRPIGPETLTLIDSLQREYARLKMNLTEEARNMPEAHYGFRPSVDIKTYAELMGHAINSQFSECAVIKGVPNPNQGINNEDKTTKAELVKAMVASFAFCDDAFSSLTQQSALQMIRSREGQITRIGVISHLIAHSNEVYGTATVYMRMKGLTPPTTERGMGSRAPELVARCPASSVSGRVTRVDASTGEMTVVTSNNATLNLRADLNTVFHIPNASKDELHSSALAKSLPNARVQVSYCTKELWVKEVTIQK